MYYGLVWLGWVGWWALLGWYPSMRLACLWYAASMHLACSGHRFPSVRLQPFLLSQSSILESLPTGCARPSRGCCGRHLDHPGNRPRQGLQRTCLGRPTIPQRFRYPRSTSRTNPRPAGYPPPTGTGTPKTSIPWHQHDVEASPSSGVAERRSRFARHQP